MEPIKPGALSTAASLCVKFQNRSAQFAGHFRSKQLLLQVATRAVGPPLSRLQSPQLNLYSLHASPLPRNLLDNLHGEGVPAALLVRSDLQGGAPRRFGVDDLFGRRFVGSSAHVSADGDRIDPASGRPWPFVLGSSWNNAVVLAACWEEEAVLDGGLDLDAGHHAQQSDAAGPAEAYTGRLFCVLGSQFSQFGQWQCSVGYSELQRLVLAILYLLSRAVSEACLPVFARRTVFQLVRTRVYILAAIGPCKQLRGGGYGLVATDASDHGRIEPVTGVPV